MSQRRDPADETQRVELPVEELGPVPVSISHAQTRWFGVPPPLALLSLALGAFVAAVALFSTGLWPYGLILLGVAALFAAGFLEVARRRPDSRLTRAAADSASTAWERLGAAAERLLARSAASAEAQRVRSAHAVLRSERRRTLLRLGDAVHREDEADATAARARLAELDEQEAELGARLAERLAQTEERIRRSRLSVQQTMLVRPGGEGTPPRPAPVPEPYPPPDEGTPPTTAPIPEPSPDPKPDPPERETRRPAA